MMIPFLFGFPFLFDGVRLSEDDTAATIAFHSFEATGNGGLLDEWMGG